MAATANWLSNLQNDSHALSCIAIKLKFGVFVAETIPQLELKALHFV